MNIRSIGCVAAMLADGQKVRCTILAATIRLNGHVSYEVAWWSGADRYTAWVEASEICADDLAPRQPLGFQ